MASFHLQFIESDRLVVPTCRFTELKKTNFFCSKRNGCLKEGDRILAIDGVKTCGLTCEESMKLLAGFRNGISLFIEYDVADFCGNY